MISYKNYPLLVGLTGGIACGKSTIASTFEKHDIPNVDADIIARYVVEPGSAGLQLVIAHFGKQFLNKNGTLNRSLLGDAIFKDSTGLQDLNKIMLPLIQEETNIRIESLKNQGYPIIVYNAALICEMGNADKYRPLIVAHCPLDQQIGRLMRRGTGHGPLTREQAMSRISAQMPVADKLNLADYIIYTWTSIEESIFQTEMIINILKRQVKQQER